MYKTLNQLGNIIFYVQDVEKTLTFFENAFGVERAFLDPSGHYGQLDTGTTALGFASFELAKQNLSKPFHALSSKELPGCEISFLTKDVNLSLANALKAGAELIAKPEAKPWGQTIAYVRDFNGILIEIGSEMMAGCAADSCCCH